VASRLPGKFVLPPGLEICLLVGYFWTTWENAIDEFTDAILVLSEELVASVETGSLTGNHLGHQTVGFMNYLVKIHRNIENT